jgi:hypothetical protein
LQFITQGSHFLQPISQGEEIMNEMPVTPTEEPKKSNTGLIIGIVVVVLLCCCCAVVAGGWFFGDQIIQSMGF